jgi:hypothetical protein
VQVSGAITKVDEWADNVEGVLLGPVRRPDAPPAARRPIRTAFRPLCSTPRAPAHCARRRLSRGGSWAQGQHGTPPRPADGGFYTATPEEREKARAELSGMQWKSPDQSKVAAGRSKIESFRQKTGNTPAKNFDPKAGFTPDGAPSVIMRKESS